MTLSSKEVTPLSARRDDAQVRIVRAQCPLRLSFAGGGTDVPPYPEQRGGAVLACTIDKYAYVTITPEPGRDVTIDSLDYDTVVKYRVDRPLPIDGTLDLVKATLNRFGGVLPSPVPPFMRQSLADKAPGNEGLRVFIHNDAPPGSGLGSSSSLVVAIVSGVARWLERPIKEDEVARLAWQVERIDVGIKGGLQDQYACAFGGFNYIEFLGDTVIVNPLRIRPDILNELSYRLLLCYSGVTRKTGTVMENQIRNYTEQRPEVMAALDELKQIAYDMKNSLLQGDLDTFGDLLNAGWHNKKKLAEGITTSELDELYEVARAHGALGGKITGAGAGGYLVFLCQFNRRHVLSEALERCGATVVPFRFEPSGIQTWETTARVGD